VSRRCRTGALGATLPLRVPMLVPMLVPLLMLAACTPPRQDGAAAVVRDEGGTPCFAIASTEATRRGEARLEQVQVVDEQGRELWRAQFAAAAPLAPERCIRYGDSTGAAAAPAQPLAAGAVYRVAVTAPMPARPREPMNYSADFCLLRNGAVHQVAWDAAAARWRREACTAAAP